MEAILAACESDDPGVVYRLLEIRDERHRVFLTLHLLSEHDDPRAKGPTQPLAPRGRARNDARAGHTFWRFRVKRPPLLDQPIVDSSENHLTTVCSKLVVDEWFDLQRTDEDRWRIRMARRGNILVHMSDRDGARAAWQTALRIFHAVGAPETAEVEAQLKE